MMNKPEYKTAELADALRRFDATEKELHAKLIEFVQNVAADYTSTDRSNEFPFSSAHEVIVVNPRNGRKVVVTSLAWKNPLRIEVFTMQRIEDIRRPGKFFYKPKSFAPLDLEKLAVKDLMQVADEVFRSVVYEPPDDEESVRKNWYGYDARVPVVGCIELQVNGTAVETFLYDSSNEADFDRASKLANAWAKANPVTR